MKLFTKLSTLLLCGVAVAVIGCSDIKEDIQGVDVKVENLAQSTSSSISELQSAISSLQAANAALESQKADKTALENAKTELQNAFNSGLADVNEAVEALTAVVNGKASAEEVAALSAKVDKAVEDLEATIANIEKALGEKADQEDVDAIAGDVDILKDGYAQTVAALTNIMSALEGKASQEDVDAILSDLKTLKTGYAQTVAALTNVQGALATLEGNLEDVEAVVETLKDGYAQTVAALTNLNGQMAVIEGRVETLEAEVKKIQAAYADLEARLQKTLTEMQAKDAAFENEFSELNKNLQQTLTDMQKVAEVNAEAIEALKKASSTTDSNLQNLAFAYNLHLEAYEDYKAAVAKELESLELQDAMIYKTIQSEVANAMTSIEETAAAIRKEQADAVAALEKKLNEAWEEERAMIYKTILDIQNTLQIAIEENKADIATIKEANDLAIALIYKTIEDTQKELFNALTEAGVNAETAAKAYTDEVQALIYKTIADIQNTLFTAIEEGDAAVIEQLTETLDKKIADAKAEINKNVADTKTELMALIVALQTKDTAIAGDITAIQNKLAEVCADLQIVAPDIDAVKALIAKTRTELEASIEAKCAVVSEEMAVLASSLQQEIARVENMVVETNALVATLEENLAVYTSSLQQNITAVENLVAETKAELNDIINGVSEKLDTVIGELNTGLVQSLVFVPEYDDNVATLYDYKFFEKSINNQVIVRATYQVTPQVLVNKIATGELEVAAALQSVIKTKAAADKYVWAEKVYVTATNEATGKFDVEIIFDAEEYAEGLRQNSDCQEPKGYALAVYVQHPANAEAVLEDEMGVVTPEAILKNCISSNFVGLSENKGYVITDNYAIAAWDEEEEAFVEYKNTEDMVQWSEVENARTPLAGHEIVIKHEGKCITLAEAAEIYRVAVEDITPLFADNFIMTDADGAPETVADCKAQVVTPATEATGALTVRTYSINGQPTVQTAGEFVGHRISNDFSLYFVVNEIETSVKDYSYAYEIDYRTANLVLKGKDAAAHELAWDLATARALGNASAPYSNPIDKNLNAKFGEYQLPEGDNAPDFDYKKVIDGVTPTTTLNGVVVDNDRIKIIPKTSILHNVAEVEVRGYEFDNKPVKYNFVQEYFAEDLYTKVKFVYELTLGAKPEQIDVEFDHEFGYTNKSYTATFNVDSLVSTTNFKNYLPAAEVGKYNPKADAVSPARAVLYANTKTTPALVNAQTYYFNYMQGTMHLNSTDIDAIRTLGGYVTRTVPTWYGVDFVYKVNLSVTEPAYGLETIGAYVNEDNEAHLMYEFKNDKYVIKSADLAHYFKVVGKDDANQIVVRFTVIPVKGSTAAPKIVYNGSEHDAIDLEGDIRPDGTIAPGSFIVDWKNYNHLTADIKAELFVNGDAVAFDTEVVTLVAEDPITLIEANAKNAQVTRKAESTETTFDVLKAVDVYLLADPKAPFAADLFVKNNSKHLYRTAKAYNAEFDINAAEAEVYYYDNGVKKVYSPELYKVDGTVITLYPETAILQTPVYADFVVEVTYALDGDVDYDTTTTKKTTVTVTFTPPTK